jgi:hypothetical protein
LPGPLIRPFDVAALYDAMDARRAELGLSWAAVARQLAAQAGALNDRPGAHPISPSTITNMAKKPRPSCQHVLPMLRWLGRSPESFLVGADDDPRFALPSAGPNHRLRWSLVALYEALDLKRRDERLSWRELADVLHCSPGQLTGLRTAKYATGIDLAMRIVQWLGRPAADFVVPATW